jgi:hypothetical protein
VRCSNEYHETTDIATAKTRFVWDVIIFRVSGRQQPQQPVAALRRTCAARRKSAPTTPQPSAGVLRYTQFTPSNPLNDCHG